MNLNYAILVNTCDKFEDCWEPFFKLFKEYWPEYNGVIYLNTEYKEYTYRGLNIISLKVCEEKKDAHLITWSECLIRALKKIENSLILYLQEDYFLKDKVKDSIVNKFADLMQQDEAIHCIHLTDQGSPPGRLSEYHNLCTVPRKTKDRICCQAALWRKDVIRQYLKPHESAWNFETYGSKRAGILKHNFYTVDRHWVKLNVFEIIPYIFTGVIGGKWFREVVPLFEQHNLNIDYSVRGFYELKTPGFSNKLLKKLQRAPFEFRSFLDRIVLRIKH